MNKSNLKKTLRSPCTFHHNKDFPDDEWKQCFPESDEPEIYHIFFPGNNEILTFYKEVCLEVAHTNLDINQFVIFKLLWYHVHVLLNFLDVEFLYSQDSETSAGWGNYHIKIGDNVHFVKLAVPFIWNMLRDMN